MTDPALAATEDDDKGAPSPFSLADAIGKQNICDMLSERQLQDIGRACMADFEIDDAAFSSRRLKIEELYKLALQVKETKNYPFESAANVKYPLLTKAALSFAALAYPSIVKDNTVVRAVVIGNDSGDDEIKGVDGNPLLDDKTGQPMKKNAGIKSRRADRVSTFMSWQVIDDMDGWEDDTDKLVHILPIIGVGFKKTYYDSVDKKNVSKLVLPQYLIINLNARTIETAFRVSELYDLYPNEIEENIRLELFRDIEVLNSTETAEDSYKPAENSSVSAQDADKPHAFIEMHCWHDLDDDGYKEPYIVWLHRETGAVARIMARFDKGDILKSGDKILKIKPECYYEKFGFIPDPEGTIYDIGFGHLLQHLNEAANTSINQLIDAGHRNIMGGGFIGSGLRIKSGDLRFKPGEFKRADSQGAVLRDAIFPLPMPEPSQVLFSLMEYLIAAAESISMMAKALSDLPANTPATTTLAIVEQGLQPFKAVFKRVHRSLKAEFRRLYALNQKYLTQKEYMEILDDPDADVKKDFAMPEHAIMPVSDPDMVNNVEMLMRAQILEGFKDDPLIDPVEVRRRIFTAVNIRDIDKLIRIPPKVPDELVEAQKAALQAQTQQANAETEKLNRDNERADIMTALKIEDTMAGIQQKISTSVLNLSNAEKADHGIRIDQFMAQLSGLETRMKMYANVAGGNQPVEAAPDNAGGAQVSPGPAGGVGPSGG